MSSLSNSNAPVFSDGSLRSKPFSLLAASTHLAGYHSCAGGACKIPYDPSTFSLLKWQWRYSGGKAPLGLTRLKLDTSSPSLKFACASPAEYHWKSCCMQVVVRQGLRFRLLLITDHTERSPTTPEEIAGSLLADFISHDFTAVLLQQRLKKWTIVNLKTLTVTLVSASCEWCLCHSVASLHWYPW